VRKAVGLRGSDADRDAERRQQWEGLDPVLRSLGFPKGL
jgi:hypothetical protein